MYDRYRGHGRNWKLKSLMRNYQETSLSECSGKTVEELWLSFTSTLEKHILNDCVPTKLIRVNASLPWIAQEIKRLIRKRDKLKFGDPDVKNSLKSVGQLIKLKIKDSYHTFWKSSRAW